VGEIMTEKDLYGEFEAVSDQLNDLNNRLKSLQEQLSMNLERKEELEIENQNLRKHIEKLSYDDNVDEDKDITGQKLSISRLNFEKIYNKGFHVCKPFYGLHRDDGECIFCQDVIYGDRSNRKEKNKKK
jgi:Uncharacterized protein conserved in bacteria